MPKPRIDRDLTEMVEQLNRQVMLLEEYTSKAFKKGRNEFIPEVAGKLRILIVHSRHNAALLFEVAKRLGMELTARLDGPPVKAAPGDLGPGDEISIDAFFDLQSVTIRVSTGLVTMTKRELIRAWCEQLGGVHEDWSVDEALIKAIHSPVLIGGMQPSVMELRNCAHTAIKHAKRVVEQGRK